MRFYVLKTGTHWDNIADKQIVCLAGDYLRWWDKRARRVEECHSHSSALKEWLNHAAAPLEEVYWEDHGRWTRFRIAHVYEPWSKVEVITYLGDKRCSAPWFWGRLRFKLHNYWIDGVKYSAD